MEFSRPLPFFIAVLAVSLATSSAAFAATGNCQLNTYANYPAKFCDTYDPFAKTSPEAAQAQKSCQAFYREVEMALKGSPCAYLMQAEELKTDNDADAAKTTGVPKTAFDMSSSIYKRTSKFTKDWKEVVQDIQSQLKEAYIKYDADLETLGRASADLVNLEVESCGKPGSYPGHQHIYLAGNMALEAENNNRVTREFLDKWWQMTASAGSKSGQNYVSSARDSAEMKTGTAEGGREDQEDGLGTELVKGAVPTAVAETAGHVAEGFGAKTVAKFIPGLSVAVDGANRLLQHRRKDSLDAFMFGARVAIWGLGAAGASVSGPAGVGVAVAADAGLTAIEVSIRSQLKHKEEELSNKFTALYKQNPTADSALLSKLYHQEEKDGHCGADWSIAQRAKLASEAPGSARKTMELRQLMQENAGRPMVP